MLTVQLTRDSVAAGDDGDAPHLREIELPEKITVEELIRKVVAAYALPRIIGGQATWCVSSRIPLAIVAQQWNEPKMLGLMPVKMSELEVTGRTVKIHVSYFVQMDPQVVFSVLARLRLSAD